MAEPTNTPVPASTPRSASPAPHYEGHLTTPPSSHGPNPSIVPIHSAPIAVNPLVAALTPNPTSPTRHAPSHSLSQTGPKPRVLHIGDPIRYNPDTFIAFAGQCEIVRPSSAEREREEFKKALKEKRWGDFHAIFRPFWSTGGEMGKWDEELVDLLPPTVKIFASAGAGFDWADTQLLGERGIVYCNSGLACAEAVADFATAMIISTFRVLPWCMTSAASPNPDDFAVCHRDATAHSHNLRGHVLGLIGFGNIGQQIAARCRHGFGMNIHYHDVANISPSVEASLGATGHHSIESLISSSDCVVLCAPALTSGKPLIGAQELACFREGGRFVNVARGSLVDDEAVADALDSGRLSSAALDVYPNEPNVSQRLRAHAIAGRAMLTCHNAGGTVETHKGFEELSMRNIMAVLGGGKPITPVNLQYLR